MVMLTLGTGLGGGLILGGRGSTGAGPSSGTWCSSSTGPRAAASAPGAATSRHTSPGAPRRARAGAVRAGGGRAPARRGRAGGRRQARESLDEIGRRLGAGIASLVNIFDPEVIVIGGGFGGSRSICCSSRRCETLRRDALPPGRDRVRVVPAELGEERGMVGAGADRVRDARRGVACRSRSARRRSGTSRTSRCACCASSREADLVLCEDTRRTRVLLDRHGIRGAALSYHEHNEAKRTARAAAASRGGRADRARRATRACPASAIPGARLVAAALEAGVPVTVLPGASAVETALVASGFAFERYQFLGYLPRGERALEALWRSSRAGRTPSSPSSRRSGCRRRSPVARGVAAGAAVAVCRELTKAFEEVVRGTAAEVPRGSPSRRRARSRSCSGRAGRRAVGRARRRRGRRRARRGRGAATRRPRRSSRA